MDIPYRRPSSAQPGCSSKLSRQARQSLGVNWVCPILKKIIFLESSWKIVQNIYRPAQSDKIFFKVGTPNPQTLPIYVIDKNMFNDAIYLLINQTETKISVIIIVIMFSYFKLLDNQFLLLSKSVHDWKCWKMQITF